MNIGEKIKRYRKEKKLTQKQLAEKSSIALMSIQRYERNERQPNLETLTKITDALDVDLWEIIDRNTNLEINVPENKATSPKLDKIISSIDNKTAVYNWIKNTDMRTILTDILEKNIAFNDLRNNLETLSKFEENSFYELNDISTNTFSREACALKLGYKSQYLNNIVNKILMTLDLENTVLNLSIKSRHREGE